MTTETQDHVKNAPVTHGFVLVRQTAIPELDSQAHFYRHEKTGAELLSLVNADENKCFGINFRTPVADSTGVAHILEHAVLCGSRKFPLKDPFIELAKGSLNTFLNAFTYPDKTCYPVASQNLKDFYNLVDVYLDTVFHPLLTEQTFQEQGWHYELEKPDDPLIFKGVVFNEMKGAYASPERVLGKKVQSSLFPDTIYHVDSGGDPKVIPDLTYDHLKNFHRTYYHPSNARIVMYGDDDPTQRLRLLDDYLSQFEAIDPQSQVALQPLFTAPRRETAVYAASEQDGSDKKGMVSVNWLLTEPSDPALMFALDALDHILVGTPGSPLRKALIDSGLGEDLTGSGTDTDLRQMTFRVGLKGIDPAEADRVETLIVDTLRGLAQNGIDPDTVEAAMNTLEFALRENNTGSFPRGLSLMLRSLTTWLYGGDPLALVAYEQPLSQIKEAVERGGYFEGLIQRFLVDNPHRTTVVLTPDTGLDKQDTDEERARLDAYRAGLDGGQIEAIVNTTHILQRNQATPDLPEVIATIPTLARGDLDKNNKPLPIDRQDAGGTTLLTHDLFTNGIVYLELGFDLHRVPQELLPYVSLFARTLTEIGTEQQDFVRLMQRIGQKTGGVRASTLVSPVKYKPESTAWLILRGKATLAQAPDLLGILRDILLTLKLDDRERFLQMASEEKARMEARIGPSGSSYVNTRLRAHFDEAAWVGEKMGGISYLFFLRELGPLIETDWPGVLAKLEALRSHVFHRDAAFANVTLDAHSQTQFVPQLRELLDALPSQAPARQTWQRVMPMTREGLTISGQVNYVGKAGSLYDTGYRLHGSSFAILNYLGTSYLWNKVRKEGGAYGVYGSLDRLSGVFAFASYRDPNLLGTLANFDGAAQYLQTLTLSDNDLTRAIIGGIADFDPYQLPDAKGYTSLARFLTENTDAARQQLRDELLATTLEDFHRFGQALEQFNAVALPGVVGPLANIEAANREQPGAFEVVRVL